MTRRENDDSRNPPVASAGRDASMGRYDSDIDADVRAWLSEPDHADLSLLTRYVAGELSSADQAGVEHRLSTDPEFSALAESVKMLWEIPGPLDREPSRADRILAERTWEKLEKRIELEQLGKHTLTRQEKRRKRRNRRRFIFGVIAAAISGWLGGELRLWWVPLPSFSVHADAPMDEGERSVTLPDETGMSLGPGSHVTYSRFFTDSNEHTLNLDGKATFTIAPGPRRILTVEGAGVEVQASEGRFTVTAYSSSPIATVKVYEGRVDVRPRTVYARGNVYSLHAGQSVQVGPGLRIERDDEPAPPHVERRTGNREVGTLTQRPVAPATPKRAAAPSSEFVNWPRDLAPRAPALADAIERDFGDRPRSITFTGRDTIHIVFWNPAFWRNDMQSKELPMESMPLVQKAAKHVGDFVWTTFGRDAGINWMHIVFVRVRKENYAVLTREVPAQDVNAAFSRENFETGRPALPMLGIVQR